jgi:BASS family bile acid:Na+ symporter
MSATFVTPAGFIFWSQFVPESEALRKSFDIRFVDMALIIVTLILAPLLLGMLLNARLPKQIAVIRPWVQRIALVIFFGILVIALISNRDNIAEYLGFVFMLVMAHNFAGLSTGYWLGRLFKLPRQDCQTLSFETGVHNTALGLLLIFRFFDGLGGMALIAAWWGIWDLVTGIGLASWWKRQNNLA